MNSKKILGSIFQIAKDVYDQSTDSGLSFLAGKSGILLFYGYLLKGGHGEYKQRFINIYSSILKNIQSKPVDLSFSNGLSGVAFCLQQLKSIGVINSDKLFEEHDLHSKLLENLHFKIYEGNWDPLHGYIGLSNYFLEKHKEMDQSITLQNICRALSQQREIVHGSKVWLDLDKNSPHRSVNLGLAHGISGVISFLSRVHRLDICNELCKEMIIESIGFLKRARSFSVHPFLFPLKYSIEQKEQVNYSRLAWCYGDLCIANACLQAGTALNNSDLTNLSIEILDNCLTIPQEESDIIDPCFCHGTAGVINIYRNAYKVTNKKSYQAYYYEQVDKLFKDFYHPGEGIGGFQYSRYDSEQKKMVNEDNVGLLEGSTGIALVLISLINEECQNWDTPFLTNYL